MKIDETDQQILKTLNVSSKKECIKLCKSREANGTYPYPDCGMLNYDITMSMCTLMKYDKYELTDDDNFIYWGKSFIFIFHLVKFH